MSYLSSAPSLTQIPKHQTQTSDLSLDDDEFQMDKLLSSPPPKSKGKKDKDKSKSKNKKTRSKSSSKSPRNNDSNLGESDNLSESAITPPKPPQTTTSDYNGTDEYEEEDLNDSLGLPLSKPKYNMRTIPSASSLEVEMLNLPGELKKAADRKNEMRSGDGGFDFDIGDGDDENNNGEDDGDDDDDDESFDLEAMLPDSPPSKPSTSYLPSPSPTPPSPPTPATTAEKAKEKVNQPATEAAVDVGSYKPSISNDAGGYKPSVGPRSRRNVSPSSNANSNNNSDNMSFGYGTGVGSGNNLSGAGNVKRNNKGYGYKNDSSDSDSDSYSAKVKKTQEVLEGKISPLSFSSSASLPVQANQANTRDSKPEAVIEEKSYSVSRISNSTPNNNNTTSSNSNKTMLSELEQQIETLKATIETLTLQTTTENSTSSELRLEIDSLRNTSTTCSDKLKANDNDHAVKVTILSASHLNEINAIKVANDTEISRLTAQHNSEVDTLRASASMNETSKFDDIKAMINVNTNVLHALHKTLTDKTTADADTSTSKVMASHDAREKALGSMEKSMRDSQEHTDSQNTQLTGTINSITSIVDIVKNQNNEERLRLKYEHERIDRLSNALIDDRNNFKVHVKFEATKIAERWVSFDNEKRQSEEELTIKHEKLDRSLSKLDLSKAEFAKAQGIAARALDVRVVDLNRKEERLESARVVLMGDIGEFEARERDAGEVIRNADNANRECANREEVLKSNESTIETLKDELTALAQNLKSKTLEATNEMRNAHKLTEASKAATRNAINAKISVDAERGQLSKDVKQFDSDRVAFTREKNDSFRERSVVVRSHVDKKALARNDGNANGNANANANVNLSKSFTNASNRSLQVHHNHNHSKERDREILTNLKSQVNSLTSSSNSNSNSTGLNVSGLFESYDGGNGTDYTKKEEGFMRHVRKLSGSGGANKATKSDLREVRDVRQERESESEDGEDEDGGERGLMDRSYNSFSGGE